MSVRRLATPESILASLAPLMATQPVLTFDDALAALRRAGVTLPDDADEAEALLDDGLDFGDGAEAFFLLDDYVIHLPMLFTGLVFTHRVTADDVSGAALHLFPDLAAWLPLLETIPVDSVVEGLDTEVPVHAIGVTVAGGEPERGELLGLTSFDDSSALLILPEDAFVTAGVGVGDLIALRLIDGTIHLDAATDAPDVDDSLITLLRQASDTSTGVRSLPEVLLHCIVADRDLFTTPAPPVTDLLEAAGVEDINDDDIELSEEGLAHLRDMAIGQLVEKYGIARHEARLVLAAIGAWQMYQTDGTPPDPEIVADTASACADAWFCHALADQAIKVHDCAEPLHAFAADVPPGAPRAVRSGLLYLQGRGYEHQRDPLAAIAAYRASADLHESPFALGQLATMEFYRGNYDAARRLLDESQADAGHPLRHQIVAATRHDTPTEPTRKPGRNEPCWCGSGRKFKVCHARAGTAAPLSHRALGLFDRATGYVFLTASHEVLALLSWAETVAGGPVPEEMMVPLVADLLLMEENYLDDFVDTYAAILPEDEVMLLEQWRLTAHRSVFDVEATVPGQSMALRDLRTGDRYDVRERMGSQSVTPGMYICTRVADVCGQYQLFGGIELVAQNQRESVLELLDSAPSARQVVAQLATRYAPMQLRSVEGDPMVICEARYRVAEPHELRGLLDELFDAAEGPDGPKPDAWVWLEEIDADQSRSLANLTLNGSELVIETTTEPRLDRVLALLDDAGAELTETEVDRTDAAALINRNRYRDLDDDDAFGDENPFDDAQAWGGTAGDGTATGASMSMEEALADPAMAAAIAEMMAAYEERWLDESIPALSGLTPREAAADPTRREDLIRLLDTFPATGSPHQMDADRLRAALGL